MLFFGTSYTNFLLAISALGKLCAAARRGSLYARTNGVQHCLQPISIQAGTPNSCHTECGGHYYCKNIQKQFSIWILHPFSTLHFTKKTPQEMVPKNQLHKAITTILKNCKTTHIIKQV